MRKKRKESEWSKLIKQYGVRGAKKRKGEIKENLKEGYVALAQLKDKTDEIVTTEEILTEIEEKPIEQISEKDARDDIKYRSDKVRQTVSTKGWQEYILPRIKACIELYEATYDDVPTFEEMKVNQAVRKELRAILEDIDRWVTERKELQEEEEKE